MAKDLSVIMDCGRLNVRVCALVKRQNKVLFELGYNNKFYCLPGGRVTFNESAEDAVRREVKEELGVDCVVERCLLVHQNFFDWVPGQACHEIAFYYLVTIADDVLENDGFRNMDGKSTFYWKTVEEVQSSQVLPRCLKQFVGNLPEETQVICERD